MGSSSSASIYNVLVAFAAAIGGLLFGYEIGVISQVGSMDEFMSYFGASVYEYNVTTDAMEYHRTKSAVYLESYIPFLFLVGCFAGAFVVMFLADSIGRKKSIILGGFLFTIGGFFQSLAQGTTVLYTGRIISGLGIGILSMVVPLYIAETSPTKLRGTLTVAFQLMITIGILIASIINDIIMATTTGNDIWRACLGAQVVPGILLVVIMIFMPYSPRWLADHDRNAEGIQILSKLRAMDVTNPELKGEYKEIMEAVEEERRVGNADFNELFKRGIWNRVLMCVILQMFQQLSGINVIMYYQVRLLEGMGISHHAATFYFCLLNNTINVLATLPGMVLIERLGRRKLLIIGGFGMAASHLAVMGFMALSKTVSPSFNMGAVISVWVFICFFGSTWGPVVWVYQSEVFPMRVRAKGTGIATMSNWGFNAVVAFVAPFLTETLDYYMYAIYGTFGLIAAIYTLSAVPETMGLAMEEIDRIFGLALTPQSPAAGSGTGGYEAVDGFPGKGNAGYVAGEMKEFTH